MPKPAKPVSVLEAERKSHRTKAELEQRRKAEAALATGQTMKAREEVKNNPVAYKEFKRLNRLLGSIGKNDALVEGTINRYCQLTAEVLEFEEKRETFYNGILALKKEFEKDSERSEKDKVFAASEYFTLLAKMEQSVISIDKQIMTKRKMLLDIEKESILTIASQLRSIPKKVEEDDGDDEMAALLEGD